MPMSVRVVARCSYAPPVTDIEPSEVASADPWESVDILVRAALGAADPWEAYRYAMQAGGRALDLASESSAAADFYVFWMELSDLFDAPRPVVVPPEGAQAVLRMAAEDWLRTPQNLREAVVDEWNSRDWLALVESLGYELQPAQDPVAEGPWRGKWQEVVWARNNIGSLHSPYAAAQHVIQHTAADPVLARAGDTKALSALLTRWDAEPHRRNLVEQSLVKHLQSLAAGDVPPLRSRRAED